MKADWHLEWVAEDGTVVPFLEEFGIRLRRGATGLDAPPVELDLGQELDAFGGSFLVGRRVGHRRIMLPVTLRHPRRVRDLVAELSDVLDGVGTLRFVGTNTRELRDVVLETPIVGGGGISLPKVRQTVVTFVALFPWWVGEEVVRPLDLDGVQTDSDDGDVLSDDPGMPSNGGITINLETSRSVETPVVLELVGPFSTFGIFVDGQSSVLSAPLGVGEKVTVRSGRGAVGPSREDGRIDWTILTPESRTVVLTKKTASLIYTTAGSGATSSATLRYEPLHRTP